MFRFIGGYEMLDSGEKYRLYENTYDSTYCEEREAENGRSGRDIEAQEINRMIWFYKTFPESAVSAKRIYE